VKTALRTLGCVVLAGIALAAPGCTEEDGGNGPVGPSPTGLPGTWRATRAEYSIRATPNVKVEVVARGTSIVLVLDAAGTFTLTSTDPGAPPETIAGTWSASIDVLTLRGPAVGESQFSFDLGGNTLTLTGGHMLYDVDGDGVDDEASLTMTLARQ
jgi:hypothetical protein